MKWRIIPLETRNAFMNMALDEAIIDAVSKKLSPPTIRFYRWNPSAVSIGNFQSLVEEVNLERCRELGIDVIRRITGGGAVYHDFEGEITYSVIAPESILPKGITESYHEICGWIIDGLKNIGIHSSFQPINDIIVEGRKISGNAQTRRKGVVLQHGTILYELDIQKMFSVLKISQEKISDKMIKAVEERVTKISNHSNASKQELYESLLKGFCNGKEYLFDDLSSDEINNSEKLKEKYSSREWNFKR